MNYRETDIACEEGGWCKVVFDWLALKIDGQQAVEIDRAVWRLTS